MVSSPHVPSGPKFPIERGGDLLKARMRETLGFCVGEYCRPLEHAGGKKWQERKVSGTQRRNEGGGGQAGVTNVHSGPCRVIKGELQERNFKSREGRALQTKDGSVPFPRPERWECKKAEDVEQDPLRGPFSGVILRRRQGGGKMAPKRTKQAQLRLRASGEKLHETER